MLISDRKKFIFIHIPKAAGTTVRKRLIKYEDRNNFYMGFDYNPVLGRRVDKPHLPYLDFLFYEDAKYISDYFVFCFVRNPYDRFYSAFQYHKKQKKLPDSISFNSYVLQHLDPLTIRYNSRFSHFCPQHFFTHYKKKCISDFIGKCERFEDDFIRLEQILGVKTEKKSWNVGNPEDGEYKYIKYFQSETIQLVNNFYKDDFLLFDYRMITPPKKSYSQSKLSNASIVYAQPEDYISYLNAIKIDSFPLDIVANDPFSFEVIAVPKDNNTQIKEVILELPNQTIVAEKGLKSIRYGRIYPQIIESRNSRFKFSNIYLENNDSLYIKVVFEDKKYLKIAEIIPRL